MAQHNQSSFLQRVLWVAFFQGAVLIIIVGRLFALQVFYSDRYKNLAEENRTRLQIQFAQRGHILDRWGEPVVKNRETFRAVILQENLTQTKELINAVRPILGLGDEEVEKIFKEIKKRPRFMPIILKNNITWDQISKIEIHALDWPGLYTEEIRARDYILKDSASHLIGYISTPSIEEAKADKLLSIPGAKIGKNGIEGFYEEEIKGINGQKSVEVNARGRVIRELETIDSRSGQDFKLTIDKDLQEYAGKLLAPYKSAAAAVIDIETGEVLCLISNPSYDPHMFFNGIRSQDWKELMGNSLAPMINKVISGQYSPGSSFKIVMALAALKAGISPDEKIHCPGFMMLGKHRFHCWRHEGHGHVNMAEALYRSCDVYFYQIARRIGAEIIIDMARKLGIGQKTGIDLPGEKSGFIADPEWKKRVRHEEWRVGDTVLTAIGQAYVLMTPLQQAVMMGEIANGGYKITPRLKLGEGKLPEKPSLGLNPDHIKFVIESLGKTVTDPTGTAYGSRIKNPEHQMGGKTSTAQVKRISMQERLSGIRESHQLPWHLRDTAEFIGFAPIQKPRYAAVVVGEHEGWGSSFAAPKVRDLLAKTQDLMEKKSKQQQERV
jgi:penicillin-binding protein 2